MDTLSENFVLKSKILKILAHQTSLTLYLKYKLIKPKMTIDGFHNALSNEIERLGLYITYIKNPNPHLRRKSFNQGCHIFYWILLIKILHVVVKFLRMHLKWMVETVRSEFFTL
jgi:hypothetical protein